MSGGRLDVGLGAGWLVDSAVVLAGPGTDDATLVEQSGGSIVVVDGETTNVKLTHPHDRAVLEATLRARREQAGDVQGQGQRGRRGTACRHGGDACRTCTRGSDRTGSAA